MPNVLVTGGFGYLGLRLVRHLVNDGRFHVRALTRRASDRTDSSLVACPVVHLTKGWQGGGDALAGIDQIVHLGAPDEMQAAAAPDDTAAEAFAFTRGLMQAASRGGVKRVILASSIHVYGSALVGHLDETTLPAPNHPYGIIKRFSEDIVAASSRTGGPASIVLRQANGFGAPLSKVMSRWTLLVNDLCRQAVEGRHLTLRSDPRTLRNFVTLEDICGAITHFLALPASDQPTRCFHVGSSRSISLGAMTELVRQRCSEVLGFTPTIALGPISHSPVSELSYDISALQRTGFTPREDFQSEIDNTLRACSTWFPTRESAGLDR